MAERPHATPPGERPRRAKRPRPAGGEVTGQRARTKRSARGPRLPRDQRLRAQDTGRAASRVDGAHAETVSYDLLAVLARVTRDLRRIFIPRAAQRSAALARTLASGIRRVARALARHRATIAAVITRVAWWSALALLWIVGEALLSGEAASPWLPHALTCFIAGLGACLFVVLAASQRHLRLAGAALATGHGAFALLHYLTTAG